MSYSDATNSGADGMGRNGDFEGVGGLAGEAGNAVDGGDGGNRSDAPFLDQWRTSGVMFFLGLFCSMGLGYGLTAISAFIGGGSATLTVSVVAGLAYIIFAFTYALWIYPSLFGGMPRLKSAKAGSFLNAFAGGLIFGAIWCSCLTKKKKGISQYVFVALVVIEIVSGVVLSAMGSGSWLGTTSPSSVSSAGSNSSSAIQSDALESAKETYVGTWDLVEWTTEDGDVLEAAEIEEKRQSGREAFMNVLDGKGVTFNFLGGYEFGVWDATSESDFTINLMNEEATDISCDGENLAFKWAGSTFSFVRGEAKETPTLFEYQDWVEPFLGSWHLVSATRDGMELGGSVSMGLTLEPFGTAILSYDGTDSKRMWQATSESTALVFEDQPYPLTLDGSTLVMDLSGGTWRFEKDSE